jgi:hypothetical protein
MKLHHWVHALVLMCEADTGYKEKEQQVNSGGRSERPSMPEHQQRLNILATGSFR